MPSDEEPLLFVHLSDIHFRKMQVDGRSVEDADIRNEVLLDLDKRVKSKPAGILVSGDIAFSGAEDEYNTARDWLSKVSTTIKAEPEDVWVVPGNHDVNRTAIKDSPILMDVQRTIRTAPPADIDNYIAKYLIEEKTNPELLFSPLKAYLSFASIYSCHHHPNQPIWTDELALNDGSTLKLVGLNSTLVSNALDDDGANKLVVGRAQLQFSREAGVEYLVMCHHPPQWLRDQDIVEDKFRERVRVQLFGHKHRQRCEEIDRKSIRLVAGAMGPDQREPDWNPVYNLLQLSVRVKDGTRYLDVKVEPRVWIKSAQRFGQDSGCKSGVRLFSLQLEPWESPKRDRPPATEKHQIQPTSDNNGDKAPVNLRRLTYQFLSLPFTKQMEVAQGLGLLRPEDKGVQDQQLFQLFFNRARELDVIDKLEKSIEHAHRK
jgi:hypothetical protein